MGSIALPANHIFYKVQFRKDGTYKVVIVSLTDLSTRFLRVNLKQLQKILTQKVN